MKYLLPYAFAREHHWLIEDDGIHLTLLGSNDLTLAGNLTGSGGLVKQGGTVFTLSGANSYTGPTQVEGGTLALTGTLAMSPSSALSRRDISPISQFAASLGWPQASRVAS
mgnify:CR=1 FL=1